MRIPASTIDAATLAERRAVETARQATAKTGDGGVDDGWVNTAQ